MVPAQQCMPVLERNPQVTPHWNFSAHDSSLRNSHMPRPFLNFKAIFIPHQLLLAILSNFQLLYPSFQIFSNSQPFLDFFSHSRCIQQHFKPYTFSLFNMLLGSLAGIPCPFWCVFKNRHLIEANNHFWTHSGRDEDTRLMMVKGRQNPGIAPERKSSSALILCMPGMLGESSHHNKLGL